MTSMTIIAAPQSRQTKVGGPGSVGASCRQLSIDIGHNVQQRACPLEMVCTVGVTEYAVVSDAVKASGQHVQQEATHKLISS